MPDAALADLADKIVFVGVDAMRCASHVPSRERIAQLKRLGKVEGDELANMLRGIDAETMRLIQAEEVSAIEKIMDEQNGEPFVDAEEAECWIPPTIQIHGNGVYLPRGINGFRASVRAVIADIEPQLDCAGNREKPWRDELADMVIAFWKANCAGESQSANRNSKTGKASAIVVFARAVFKAANPRQALSDGTLANLLNTRR